MILTRHGWGLELSIHSGLTIRIDALLDYIWLGIANIVPGDLDKSHVLRPWLFAVILEDPSDVALVVWFLV